MRYSRSKARTVLSDRQKLTPTSPHSDVSRSPMNNGAMFNGGMKTTDVKWADQTGHGETLLTEWGSRR